MAFSISGPCRNAGAFCWTSWRTPSMTQTTVCLNDCIKNNAMSKVLMARYRCHKEVHALPLTRGDYNRARGWTIPAEENPDDAGYLVVYSRGTADEYVSWSPKHVFDSGYNALDTDNSNKPGDSDKAMQADFESSGSIYPKVEADRIGELMAQVKYDVHVCPETTTTVVTAMLPMGPINFTLCSEIMACVDPRNFNAELGAKYGIEKAAGVARNKLWELEGYSLAKSMCGA